MAGGVIAFSNLFDVTSTLAARMRDIYGRRIPVQLFKDSMSLFDVISNRSRTSEMRTMLDIAAAREGFRDKVIFDIGFVRGSQKIANGLTKSMSQTALQCFVTSGLLYVQAKLWIVGNQRLFLVCPYCLPIYLSYFHHPKFLRLITATSFEFSPDSAMAVESSKCTIITASASITIACPTRFASWSRTMKITDRFGDRSPNATRLSDA